MQGLRLWQVASRQALMHKAKFWEEAENLKNEKLEDERLTGGKTARKK
jgi:hypothetical protein